MTTFVALKKEDLELEEVHELQKVAISYLIKNSEEEGFNFLRRLLDDWVSGLNRFDERGEVLFMVKYEDAIVAIGGVNQDPYKDNPNIGRIRHVYVNPKFRGRGIGGFLIGEILKHCTGMFKQITLRTDNPEADRFYSNLGFESVRNSVEDTHLMMLV